MYFALPFVFLAHERSPDLATALRELSIPVLRKDVVAAHKRDMVRMRRTGIFLLIGPLIYLFEKTLFAVFWGDSRRPVETAEPLDILGALATLGSRALVRLCAAAALAITLVATAGYIAGALPPGSLFGVAACILFWVLLCYAVAAAVYLPVMSFVHIVAFLRGTDHAFELAQARATWERRLITDRHAKSLTEHFRVPERLHGRVQRLSALPDAEVHVEEFLWDPFLVVTRRVGPFGLFFEEAYIGGWDTGVPAIDEA
jgi:hypothetical protein